MQIRLQTSLARWLSRQPSGGLFRGEGFSLGTQKGLVRRENQDRIAVAKFFPRESNHGLLLGVISDGMGGMAAGGQCAEIAVSTFLSTVLGKHHIGLSSAMLEAAELANRAVFEEFHGDGGATLTAIALYGDTVCAVNVGDSRVYSLRTNNTIVQESQDDTVSSRLAAIGEASENARTDLLQYIGMGPDLAPHLLTDLNSEQIRGILITSDGAHSVPPAVLAGLAAHAQFPKDLIERLLSVSLWLGGKDNASALALTFQRRQRPQSFTEALEFFGPSGEKELPLEYLCDAASQAVSFQHARFHEENPKLRHSLPPVESTEPGKPNVPEMPQGEPPEKADLEPLTSERAETDEIGSLPHSRRSRRKSRARKNSPAESLVPLPQFVIEDVSEPLPQEGTGTDSKANDPAQNRRSEKGRNS